MRPLLYYLKMRRENCPILKNLQFDPGKSWGQIQQVPLTNGLGFWTMNFFMKKKEGFWGDFLDFAKKISGMLTPVYALLGLPAIAATALTQVDKVMG